MCMSKLLVSLLSTTCLVPAESLSHPEARDNRPLAAIAGNYYYGDGLGINCYLDREAGRSILVPLAGMPRRLWQERRRCQGRERPPDPDARAAK